MLIDRFLPGWSMRQVDRIAVAADVEEAWETARNVDLYEMPLARALFWLRTVPERFAAWIGGAPRPLPAHSYIDDIARSAGGFLILGEEPGREVVIGSVGTFWRLAIDFAKVTPDSFARFAEPGFGKLAWCIRVDPRDGGGSWITVEVRVTATDPRSLRKFRRYWFVIGRFSHWIRRSALRLFARRLGRSPGDARRPLAGDDFLPDARVSKTHSRTINAPLDRVWPWLAQMGARRAGWYSLDRLDNGGRESLHHIDPALQSIERGDLLPATPSDTGGFAVLRVEPPSVLVLGSPGLLRSPTSRDGRGMLGAGYVVTWAFVLEPIGDSVTRLHVRVRGAYAPGIRTAVVRPLVLGLHAVMQRFQLRGIERRVARAAPEP